MGESGSVNMVKRPRGSKNLQSTWAFKIKRYPDGGLKNHKAFSVSVGTNRLIKSTSLKRTLPLYHV